MIIDAGMKEAIVFFLMAQLRNGSIAQLCENRYAVVNWCLAN